MSEITFEDSLTHYSTHLKRVKEEIASSRKNLKTALGAIEDGWQGEVAKACKEKIEDIRLDLKNANKDISEATSKISKLQKSI